MIRTEAPAPNAGWLTLFGLVVTAGFVTALLFLQATKSYDAWIALLLVPILMLVSLPALLRQAHREEDRTLLWILVAALLVKFLGAIVNHYFSFVVYDRVADATAYHHRGAELAIQFRQGNFETGLNDSTGTNFIRILTGAVYTLIGTTEVGGYIVFSWMGFWGLFFFYRAFRLAVPEGHKRFYASLLFFLPSLVFWPSSIGKEAWMLMTLGLAAVGAARFFRGSTLWGFILAGVGLFLAALVRPHVAAIMGMGMVVGYMFIRPSEHLKELGPIVKFFAVGVLAILALVLFLKTEDFVEGTHVDTGGGVGETLDNTRASTARGGSSFSPPSVRQRPYLFPLAALTVLFRPLPMEAGNLQGLIAALEGLALAGLSLVRLRWMFAAAGSVRRQPYVAAAIFYILLFIVVYSSIANFGILTRQRVQVLPMYLILLAVPPKEKRIAPEQSWDEEAYSLD